ncbi:transposase IS204/IS1001/IS1096/IS1165 family protein [Liquorilactobacillus mali KCTC 3596 = DSM 20444]|uniref:Transposase IS204 IS1001 IS1096 IS1165 family protein n=1 Tax=Liquorilactobacillus mali KCTC 3596 = DSM 20444 TaxID=1046596 RepID=J0UT51_9LACO|nr:ISL3 family transposase [Liquorilactobacillus mali]EJF00437.1 transposase IS204/IS1001/IS1096/IS1165 family protein [Liquorilactobacillus mali KCTC 3596 = DSM 20444]KRN08500.1 transposase IS204 IS1001 IS1096 IS1165 family protein [Liquorilactobacillus mali KCTC 3596 = DSM 20444]
MDGARKDDGVIRLNGSLDYQPQVCPNCGIINEGQIINYGWRKTTVRFAKTLGNNVILHLNRRNFQCKECQTTFLAQTDLVPKHCTISNPTRKECLEKLEEPVSLKHIANELSLSDSFVGRQLMHAQRDFRPNWHFLPEVILMDEIKSTKSATDAMSFEFMDAQTHELIDLLLFRTIHQLEIYFYHFDQAARESVKIIVSDMNYTYPKLTKTVFPNAIVVMDKFHIINALNRAFNKTRVRLMKQFAPSSREFRALKRYWKLLLVPSEQLDFEHFHKWTNFPYWITATDVVHNLLSLDSELKQTYEVLNHVRTAIQHKDWNNYNAAFWKAEDFSEEMSSTIEMLQTHHGEIHNTFITQYSNGPLEGSNNKIKAIKRASFGYHNFFKLRSTIYF